MSQYLSEKIRTLSFLAMLLVVLLHAQLISLSTGWELWVQRLFTEEITRIAVPLFFSISGFLFYQRFSKPFISFFKKKFIRRLHSVLIPYLIWSILGFAFMYLVQFLPFTFAYSIHSYDWQKILYSIFIQPVGTYQLWFLRDLFVVILFSPAIYLCIKYLGKLFLLILLLLWGHGIQYGISIESIFFFVLGSYFVINESKLLEIKRDRGLLPICITILWISCCVGALLMGRIFYSHHIAILLGMVSLWMLYDKYYFCLYKYTTIIKKMASYTFFIYVAHEPLLTVIKKALLYVLGSSDIVLLFIYIIAPISTTIACLIIGEQFRKHFPQLYNTALGGR